MSERLYSSPDDFPALREQEPFDEEKRIKLARAAGELIRLSVLDEASQEPEIFDTIQGEGRNIGKHTAFIRLSDCNLNCNFCDTAFTWSHTAEKAALHEDGIVYDKEIWQTEQDVSDMAQRVFETNQSSVVITGGEPLMQQKAIINLGNRLREKNPDYHLEIETAGTIPPTDELVELIDQFNVSPKLDNSGNLLKKRRKPLALQKLAKEGNADFKFVVVSPEDINEILELVELSGISKDRVYLMPEGRTREEIQSHAELVADLCKEHGFNMTTRLHIEIWDSKKNV